MDEIRASIRYNLRNLTRFSGRDPRGLFWPWTIFLILLDMAVGLLGFVPVMIDMMVKIQRYLIEHPEGLPPADPARPFQPLPAELMPDYSLIAMPLVIVNLVFVLLVAASVARRLHDRGFSGWWGLLPVPSMTIGLYLGFEAANAMMRTEVPNSMVLLLLLNNLFYWAVLIGLIVVMAQAGTRGRNRYGPDPLAPDPV